MDALEVSPWLQSTWQASFQDLSSLPVWRNELLAV